MLNKELRRLIVEMICRSGEGHIPSSFSIVDLINFIYERILKFKSDEPDWVDRDYFFLSKGHGCAGFYVVLQKFGILTMTDLEQYSTSKGILGGHPDMAYVPGAEASTGSLGHGFPTAVGTALGLKIQKRLNKVLVLVGDGECHEGTIWEAAQVARNLRLGNLCVIVDWNGSASQLMPVDDIPSKWRAFGWNTLEIDGHSEIEMQDAFDKIEFREDGIPSVIVARTVKGKGVSFIEGHGPWHHKVPNSEELEKIMQELT